MVPTPAWAYIATGTPRFLQKSNILSMYSGKTSIGRLQSSMNGIGLRSPFIPRINPRPLFLKFHTFACSIWSSIIGLLYPIFWSCKSFKRLLTLCLIPSSVLPINSTIRIAWGSPSIKPHNGAQLRFLRALMSTSESMISTAEGLCFNIGATARIASGNSLKWIVVSILWCGSGSRFNLASKTIPRVPSLPTKISDRFQLSLLTKESRL